MNKIKNSPMSDSRPSTLNPSLNKQHNIYDYDGETECGTASEKGDYFKSNNNAVTLDLGSMVQQKKNNDLLALSNKKRRRKFWLIGSGILLILLIIIGVVAGVLVSRSRNKSNAVIPSGSTSLDGEDSPDSPNPIPLSNNNTTTTPKGSTIPTNSSSSTSPIITPNSTVPIKHRLVVFGASYMDNGHNRPNAFSASLRPQPYFGGRASNGVVMVESLSPLIGSKGIPAVLHDYAYIGAMIDTSLNPTSATNTSIVPDIKTQFTAHINDIKSGTLGVMPIGSKTLVVIWIGINPLIDIWLRQITGKSSMTSSMAEVGAQVTTLFREIDGLKSFLDSTVNPADFLILPAPPLETLPFTTFSAQKQTPSSIQASITLMKNLNDAYNIGIEQGISNLIGNGNARSRIFRFDVIGWWKGILANPSSGGVTDVITPCLSGSSACSNPSNHFFWDSIHMTTGVHTKLANSIAPIINAGWSS